MVEYIHNHPSGARAKTLFATHYHELNEMEEICPRVKNFNVSVREQGRNIIFLRKLVPGGVAHSFGIHVALLAGMPQRIVDRAGDILTALEASRGESTLGGDAAPVENADGGKKKGKLAPPAPAMQLSMFQLDDPVLKDIRDQLKKLDINSLTPIEALNKLNEIKRITGL
jgi:DNA mismatch repair protein MutS